MQINFASFRQLDVDTLYALIKLRVDVFVVEQACAYPELDGLDLDPGTWHVLGYDNDNDNDKLIAYARILNLHQGDYLPHANVNRTTSYWPGTRGETFSLQGIRYVAAAVSHRPYSWQAARAFNRAGRSGWGMQAVRSAGIPVYFRPLSRGWHFAC